VVGSLISFCVGTVEGRKVGTNVVGFTVWDTDGQEVGTILGFFVV